MASAEGVAYTEGSWAVFNVITTVGFGDGLTSTLSQLIAAGGFVAAAVCWFGLVSVEVGLSRSERDARVRDARSLSLAAGTPNLFHNN
jgi:hypothetical protein